MTVLVPKLGKQPLMAECVKGAILVLDMKVQHPIQHILASFFACLPAEESLRIEFVGGVEGVGGSPCVCGVCAVLRQVFADYYSAGLHERNRTRSTYSLRECRDSIQDVLRFTSEWGPLRPNCSGDPLLERVFGKGASPEQYFAFAVDTWRGYRDQFREAIQRVDADRGPQPVVSVPAAEHGADKAGLPLPVPRYWHGN